MNIIILYKNTHFHILPPKFVLQFICIFLENTSTLLKFLYIVQQGRNKQNNITLESAEQTSISISIILACICMSNVLYCIVWTCLFLNRLQLHAVLQSTIDVVLHGQLNSINFLWQCCKFVNFLQIVIFAANFIEQRGAGHIKCSVLCSCCFVSVYLWAEL